MVKDDDRDRPDNATSDPEETVEGQSFYNAATTGSGTITVDGEYAEPLPDPTQVRGLGPDRTSGGRRVPGTRDPDSVRVAEVTEKVAGSRQTRAEDTGSTSSGGSSTADTTDTGDAGTTRKSRTSGK
jgi:hypothetical protein